jgi:hypothetical protein
MINVNNKWIEKYTFKIIRVFNAALVSFMIKFI